MDTIRVVIVDDSSLVRDLLRAILEDEGGIEVVGEATNGRQAVDLVRELRPSLVTMDLEMPVMDGLEAIEAIMCTRAVPILVVSSVADAHRALDAVGRGALEVVAKPDTSPEAAAHLVSRVRLLAGVSVITRLRLRSAPLAQPQPRPAAPPPMQPVPLVPVEGKVEFPHLFAMASSTGGPQALAEILPALPPDFPCPILVAQHISDGFAQGMADWLGSLCKLPVRLAQDGDALVGGVIYLSPSEQHLAVASPQRLALRERAAGDLYRPSCDVLLASVAGIFGSRATGMILTGMGHDGAAGLAAIRAAGGSTLAQDEASSVIFGMNRVAIERGAVQRVLPLSGMAAAMLDKVRQAQGATAGWAP